MAKSSARLRSQHYRDMSIVAVCVVYHYGYVSSGNPRNRYILDRHPGAETGDVVFKTRRTPVQLPQVLVGVV